MEQSSICNPSLVYSSVAKQERENVLQAVLIGDMEVAADIIQSAKSKASLMQKVLSKIKSAIR